MAEMSNRQKDIRGLSKSKNKYQARIRKAKAFVISVMGEFANVCRVKQVTQSTS